MSRVRKDPVSSEFVYVAGLSVKLTLADPVPTGGWRASLRRRFETAWQSVPSPKTRWKTGAKPKTHWE